MVERVLNRYDIPKGPFLFQQVNFPVNQKHSVKVSCFELYLLRNPSHNSLCIHVNVIFLRKTF